MPPGECAPSTAGRLSSPDAPPVCLSRLMDLVAVVLSSALVSAIVGSAAGYFSQRSLAKRQALLDYEYNAKKRLYEVIGPLRFQLLIACRDVVRRVSGRTRSRSWNMDPAGYYGSNTLYRILRPLAICTLIERKMNAADFSVDPKTVELLKFEVSAYRMLANRDPLPYYDKIDWATQSQHVFRDNLRRASTALIKESRSGPGVMDYSEFLDMFPSPAADPRLAPLAAIIKRSGTSLANNAPFWTRLVGYAYLCQAFIATYGTEMGFTDRTLDVNSLVALARDPEIQQHSAEQEGIFRKVVVEGL